MTALPPPPSVPDTHVLSYADEEVVIRYRAGESPEQIADALGHHWSGVRGVLQRAAQKGVSLRRGSQPERTPPPQHR